MSDELVDFSAAANLRTRLDVWPRGVPRPANVVDLARAAVDVALPDLLAGRGSNVTVLRFAVDDVSIWHIDALGPVSIEDFVRAVVRVFEPFAYGAAVIQPLRVPGDPTVRGVHCRAAFGDTLVDLSGPVASPLGPVGAGSAGPWTVRHGHANDDRGRWIGVPPTIELHLPMLGAADA